MQQLQAAAVQPQGGNNFNAMLPDIQTGAINQDKLMRFNQGVDGKALLHDLDQKFESSDRMMNYLLSQQNSLDQAI
jgi:hypothetical protein